MSKCEHVKCITTPSSRVSPHLLRKGELDAIDFVAIAIPSLCSLRLSHIKVSPLIMPLVAWWEKICAPSDWRTLIWCDAIDSSAVTMRYSVPYGTPFLAAAAARVTFLLNVSACIGTLAHSKCADKYPKTYSSREKKHDIEMCNAKRPL